MDLHCFVGPFTALASPLRYHSPTSVHPILLYFSPSLLSILQSPLSITNIPRPSFNPHGYGKGHYSWYYATSPPQPIHGGCDCWRLLAKYTSRHHDHKKLVDAYRCIYMGQCGLCVYSDRTRKPIGRTPVCVCRADQVYVPWYVFTVCKGDD